MEVSVNMDNDSGYVSHNQESNLDSSLENLYSKSKLVSTHELYLNEDALLERPLVKNKHNECERFDSFDSVINSSQESVQTTFSGFEDSDADVSFVIPESKPIVWNSSAEQKEKHRTDRNGCSKESDESFNEGSSKATMSHKVLTNLTNIYDQNVNPVMIKNVFTDNNKENIRPSETPKKQYENRLTSDVSPDLFSEEESSTIVIPVKQKSPLQKNARENYCNKDVKLLRKVQSCLSGVHPPPNLTIIQMTVVDMLNKIEENKDFFWISPNKGSSVQNEEQEKSLLISDKADSINNKWPEILNSRYHGLHYNRSKVSEAFEHLCSRYAERYVGVETQSTCTVFDSNPSNSLKRKLSKPKWAAKSPGRRLSHLARRRITFSSANLQSTSSSSIFGSRARQILVDAKKMNTLNKRSPKKSPRKTPSKSPFKIRKSTPSSSAKKKLAMKFRQMSGEFETRASSSSSDYSIQSFKRALFSSPKQEKSMSFSGSQIEKKSTKRALFSSPLKHSPQKKSPFKSLLERKRKRTDADDENPLKLARSMSFDVKTTQSESKLVVNRALSETNMRSSRTEELSDQHKKKLQWAVYESLRLQNITSTHPQYKIFASVLARVTRKFLPNLRMEGRTSDKMFRIARYHSYAVVKGKTVDEIVNDYVKNRAKNQKPHGYVGIEEFNNLKGRESHLGDKENILQDRANIMESIEKRREHAGAKSKCVSENKIDRIKKVISFEDNCNKKV